MLKAALKLLNLRATNGPVLHRPHPLKKPFIIWPPEYPTGVSFTI